MRKILALSLGAAFMLSGCSTPSKSPEPSPSNSVTLKECATMGFDHLKELHGVAYLSDHKAEATAFVKDLCKGLS